MFAKKVARTRVTDSLSRSSRSLEDEPEPERKAWTRDHEARNSTDSRTHYLDSLLDVLSMLLFDGFDG